MGDNLPAQRGNGEVTWRRPCYATIHRMVTNPIYGGAYAYGRTGAVAQYSGSALGTKIRRKPRAKWLALKPGAHDGYLDWERAEAICRMVSENIPNRHHGAPKHGDALLAGLVRCRREGIVQNLYYPWSKEFLEAGKKRLAGDTARAATSSEVKDLRRTGLLLGARTPPGLEPVADRSMRPDSVLVSARGENVP